jgi:hypothetical protein
MTLSLAAPRRLGSWSHRGQQRGARLYALLLAATFAASGCEAPYPEDERSAPPGSRSGALLAPPDFGAIPVVDATAPGPGDWDAGAWDAGAWDAGAWDAGAWDLDASVADSTEPALDATADVGWEPAPDVGWEPVPDVGWEPAPDVGWEPAPDVGWEPAPDVGWEPAPDVGWEPAPDVGWEPVPDVGWEPAPDASDACVDCADTDTLEPGCDGVPGSGLVEDVCGVCGGMEDDESQCAPEELEYVMSIYFLPADGADEGKVKLTDAIYATPNLLRSALFASSTLAALHEKEEFVGLGHSVGHAYLSFYTRKKDGTGVKLADGFPTGQTGGGGPGDYLNYGAGGTMLQVYKGELNKKEDAELDIERRQANHGTPFVYEAPGKPKKQYEKSAQLIGQADFLLSEKTWKAAQERVALHRQGGASRYGLFLEPSIESKRPGEKGGEGAGCTSFVAMCAVYSGALDRLKLHPIWTRTATFGERTIGLGTYPFGSHLRPKWPHGHDVKDPHEGTAAWKFTKKWTYQAPADAEADRVLTAVPPGAAKGEVTELTQLEGYWYDPDKMYEWVLAVHNEARKANDGSAKSIGRTWKCKHKNDPNTKGAFPHIETDATDATPRSTWDTSKDPYTSEWTGK